MLTEYKTLIISFAAHIVFSYCSCPFICNERGPILHFPEHNQVFFFGIRVGSFRPRTLFVRTYFRGSSYIAVAKEVRARCAPVVSTSYQQSCCFSVHVQTCDAVSVTETRESLPIALCLVLRALLSCL